MNKSEKLKMLADEVEVCEVCKKNKSGKAVFGEGSPDAKLFFIGEAPGRTEAKTGRPFVGRSGKLLRTLIKEIGLKEEEVYLTSPVKYLPDYGTPTKEDVKHGKIYLDKQLDIIKPKIIVLLGRIASLAILGKLPEINKMHGKIVEENGRKYFITYHPAAGLRFPPLKKKLMEDFQKLKIYLR